MPNFKDYSSKIAELDSQEQYNVAKLSTYLRGAKLTPESVGEMLPEAVIIGEAEHQNVSKSMVEVTERAIDYSVRRDPEPLSSALFPIIGTAIRKALNKMLNDMMVAMNNSLQNVFSLKRIQWRYESWKTGVPYLEIILKNTLQYQVEHVFLIHAKTGILLHSVSRKGSTTADNDMMASMLTAVQSYIRDSLSLDKAETVNGISVGEYTILVEEGPRAILALVIKGIPDGNVRNVMQDTLENIHLRLAKPLEKFNGNTDVFVKEEALLTPCLLSQEKGGKKSRPIYAIILISLVLAGLAVLLGFSLYRGHKRNLFINAINAEPGMMVVSAKNHFGKTTVKLLRDVNSKPIDTIAGEYGTDLQNFIFDIEEFSSVVYARAPQKRQIPESLLEMGRKLGEYIIFFVQDSEELRPGQEAVVREAGELITAIVDEASRLNFQVTIDITGHAAGGVADEASISISEERARKAMMLFSEINKPLVRYVRIYGAGISEPLAAMENTEEDKELNRSVTFKAVFE